MMRQQKYPRSSSSSIFTLGDFHVVKLACGLHLFQSANKWIKSTQTSLCLGARLRALLSHGTNDCPTTASAAPSNMLTIRALHIQRCLTLRRFQPRRKRKVSRYSLVRELQMLGSLTTV
jgi:hypothetical protein